MAVKGALQDPFYNRAELDYFKSMFMGQPVVATLLVGPCGTTASSAFLCLSVMPC